MCCLGISQIKTDNYAYSMLLLLFFFVVVVVFFLCLFLFVFFFTLAYVCNLNHAIAMKLNFGYSRLKH